MKTKYILSIAFMLLIVRAEAQENFFYINWNGNIPLSSKEYIDNASGRGAKIGYRFFFGRDRRFSAGVDFNWAQYDQYKPKETFETESGAITTDYFNYIYQYGLTASSQYYFPLGEKDRFFPYVGLGLGVNRNEYNVYYNIYTDSDKAFGFLARPEAGILVRIGERRRMGVMAAVHYDYSTNKSDELDYKNFSTVGFQLGIMMLQW
ncbi:outer membrane beta-barrel protein [Chryseolinea sp. H1M3-3]|uniref:outer membrane beta-barrel protein n=1 Tax=Chryseolinea sp. H1M3-3 TaxID=3034144 RepID=UPI0023ED9A76|nr:outer membrane beta-barrel protein [Chryseolinea sp. H1M3-3]